MKTAPVEIPKDTANGDYTTTFALAAAKALGKPPRVIAQALLDHMDLAGQLFYLCGDRWPRLPELPAGRPRGMPASWTPWKRRGDALRHQRQSQRVRRSWWSLSPPTPPDPMHMGNARGGVLGDTLASVLTACGADVSQGILCQRRRTPDRQVCPLHRGPLSPAHQRRGFHRLPGGRLSGRGHQGTGQGLLRRTRRQPPERLRAGAAGRAGSVRPVREPAPDEGGSGALQDPLRYLVLRVLPSTRAAMWPRLWTC